MASPEQISAFGTTNSNSLYSTDGSTTATISGNNLSSRFPRYYNENTANRSENPHENSFYIYGYGNYYTWAAGVADISDITGNEYVDSSICPAGWELPSGGDANTDSDYLLLGIAIMGYGRPTGQWDGTIPYGANTAAGKIAYSAFTGYPNNFILGGYIRNGQHSEKGKQSKYLSSSSLSGGFFYGFSIGDENLINPGTAHSYKDAGASVRCIYNYHAIN